MAKKRQMLLNQYWKLLFCARKFKSFFGFHFSENPIEETHLQKRFDFGEESPPVPISQLKVRSGISLDDSDGVDLLLSPLESAPRQVTTAVRLEVDDQI